MSRASVPADGRTVDECIDERTDPGLSSADSSMQRTFLEARPRLLRIAAAVLGETALAEDAVQEAWLRWVRLHATVSNPAAWLARITHNLAVDWVRTRSRHEVNVDPQDDKWGSELAVHPSADGGDGLGEDQAELRELLGLVMSVHSPLERIVFVLRHGFGWSYSDISDLLGRTEPALRQHNSRATGRVRRVADSGLTRVGPVDGAVVSAFRSASAGGDIAALIAQLAPGVPVAPQGLAYTDRGLVHRVAGLLLAEGDRLVFCRRRADLPWFPDVWDLPGDHRRRGESAEACAARSAQRQVGVDVGSTSAVGRYEEADFDLVVMAAGTWTGRLRNRDPGQHTEVALFRREEARDLELADPRLLHGFDLVARGREAHGLHGPVRAHA